MPQYAAAAQTPTPTPVLKTCWVQSRPATAREGGFHALTNITLVSFCIEYYAAADKALVTWETATELDTSGYFIWRSDTQNGTYEVWSPFVQAEGGLVSMKYEWQDDDVHRGHVYFYKLEEIDTNNATAGIFGPLRFDFFATTPNPQPGNTPTHTATATVGPSPTRTYTATAGPTPTRSLTPVPSNTPSAPTATLVPIFSPTVTPTASENMTATATLEPLPPIMLLFPAPTATPPPTQIARALAVESDAAQSPPEPAPQANLTGRIWLMGGIVFLLWAMLTAILILYLYKAQE